MFMSSPLSKKASLDEKRVNLQSLSLSFSLPLDRPSDTSGKRTNKPMQPPADSSHGRSEIHDAEGQQYLRKQNTRESGRQKNGEHVQSERKLALEVFQKSLLSGIFIALFHGPSGEGDSCPSSRFRTVSDNSPSYSSTVSEGTYGEQTQVTFVPLSILHPA